MDNNDLADRIELETRKRMLSENAEAFIIFRSCIVFRPETLEVEFIPDNDLYGTDAIESFRNQLRQIHQMVKKEMV